MTLLLILHNTVVCIISFPSLKTVHSEYKYLPLLCASSCERELTATLHKEQ